MRDDAPRLGIANIDAVRAQVRREIVWKKSEQMHQRSRPERWRLAGWLGCVLAAEWEACAGVGSPANVESWQRDPSAALRAGSARPAGEDASVPSRFVIAPH
jgi:hypothetical protein